MSNGKSVASLVLGVISCVLSLVSYFVLGLLSFPALILGIIGLVLSILAKNKEQTVLRLQAWF